MSAIHCQELQCGGNWNAKARGDGSLMSAIHCQELQCDGSKSTKAKGAEVGA